MLEATIGELTITNDAFKKFCVDYMRIYIVSEFALKNISDDGPCPPTFMILEICNVFQQR